MEKSDAESFLMEDGFNPEATEAVEPLSVAA
jgi:hypothetical protein